MKRVTSSAGPSNHTGQFIAIGAAGGIVGGLLGGGSGVVYVPALAQLTTFSRPTLHGTAGAANIAVTGVGAAAFAVLNGSIALNAGAGLVVGGSIGALLGARLILHVSEPALRGLFIAILCLTAAKLLLSAAGLSVMHGTIVPKAWTDAPLFVVPASLLLGFVIGVWAAGMGLGGGLLAVPALLAIFGTDLPTAEGTSLLMFFPNAVIATIVHARQGTADIRASWRLNVGAVPGAIVGVVLALAIGAYWLSIVFGGFTATIAMREISRALRSSA